MAASLQPERFPRGPLVAIGGLLAVTLLLVSAARITGHRDDTGVAPSATARELRFEDRSDGGVAVYDARTNGVVGSVAPGEDGFVRATMRSLARERLRVGAGPEVPFRLASHGDGRITLEDPTTGRRLALEAFGPTNAAAFARFLDTDGAPRR
jgi:putative photosynthetic complex assembly protein